MSKRADQERKAKEYYDNNSICCSPSIVVENFLAGYEQAEKDTIERACEWLSRHYDIDLVRFRKAVLEEE